MLFSNYGGSDRRNRKQETGSACYKNVCSLKDDFMDMQQVPRSHELAHKNGPGPEVIILYSCSTELSMKFILLINVKMPTIVGILTFITRINTASQI